MEELGSGPKQALAVRNSLTADGLNPALKWAPDLARWEFGHVGENLNLDGDRLCFSSTVA